jgi:hypothetical protein
MYLCKYTVNEEAAKKKIKAVFKMFNTGMRYKEIADKLGLDQRNVKVYLKNEQYTGIYNRCGVRIENIIPALNSKNKNLNDPAKKASLERRKRNLLKLVEDGALPYEDLRERLLELDAEINKFVALGRPIIINRSDVYKCIRELSKISDESALIEAFITKIIVDPKTGSYEIKFGPSHFGTE